MSWYGKLIIRPARLSRHPGPGGSSPRKGYGIMNHLSGKARHFGFTLIIGIIFTVMISGVSVSAASYKESDYSHVYSYSYYIKKNKSKLSSSVRSSRSKALRHFVEHGMAQGLQAISNFRVGIYKKNYPDLAKKYGSNFKKYYLHYQSVGYKNRYAKHYLTSLRFDLTLDPNKGSMKIDGKTVTSAVKIRHSYNRKITLPTPKRSGYEFAGWRQVKGTGTLKGNKFTYTINKKGVNLVKASWAKKTVNRYALAYKIADYAKTQLGNGGAPYWNYFWKDNWCCMFVTYCANKVGFVSSDATDMSCGSGRFPKTASQRELAYVYSKRGQLKLRNSGYKPKKGDLIFFTNNTSNQSDYQSYRHVGIVYGTSGNDIITIEGNTGTWDMNTSYVKKCIYNPVDSSSAYHTSKAMQIAAYGIIR